MKTRSSNDEDNLVEVEHGIKGIRVRGVVLLGEDLPMLIINTKIMLKYSYIDTAIVLSLILSA